MNTAKDMAPFLAVTALVFYVSPFVARDTGSMIVMLVVVIPLVCFICACAYGVLNPFTVVYSVLVAVLFVPTILLFYNESAWVYAPAYGLCALVGNAMGLIARKMRRRVRTTKEASRD